MYDHGLAVGVANPFVIGRHVHPGVPQATPPPTPADDLEPGIDYMGLAAAAHAEALGEQSISSRELRLPGMEDSDRTHADDHDTSEGAR